MRDSEKETLVRKTAADKRATEASTRASFEHLPVGTELRRKAHGNSHPLVASTLGSLGWTQRKAKRPAEARASFDEAVAIHEKTGGVESAAAAFPLTELAELALDEGKPKAALAPAARALALREKRLGHEHPDLAGTLTTVARVQLVLGEPARAAELLERSITVVGNDSPRDKAAAEIALARALRALDRDAARALVLARSAESIYAKDETGAKAELGEVRSFLTTNERWLGAAR